MKKQDATRKLTLYIGEFKAMAEIDPKTKDWTKETQELIDVTHYNWNVYCYNTKMHYMHKLFLIETKVAKDVVLGIRNESASRDYWRKHYQAEDAEKYKDTLKLNFLDS